MDYPKIIVSNQKEESISIQRVMNLHITIFFLQNLDQLAYYFYYACPLDPHYFCLFDLILYIPTVPSTSFSYTGTGLPGLDQY